MSGPVEGMVNKSLFGESMSVYLPSDASDVSELRQVPDNQEVFVHPVTDQSIIIEILEYVQEPDDQALRTHYNDLASSNDAAGPENSEVLGVEQLNLEELAFKEFDFPVEPVLKIRGIEKPPVFRDRFLKYQCCTSAYILTAQQRVAKFKESARNTLYIFVALFRLSDFDADILVTFNSPINVNPDSSSHADIPVSAQPWTLNQFRNALLSLKLLNPALFG